MLYELSDEQVKNLLAIVSNVSIKGSEAPIIIGLVQALRTPLKDERTVTAI